MPAAPPSASGSRSTTVASGRLSTAAPVTTSSTTASPTAIRGQSRPTSPITTPTSSSAKRALP